MPPSKVDLNISTIFKIIKIETPTSGTKTTTNWIAKAKQNTQDLLFREIANLYPKSTGLRLILFELGWHTMGIKRS